MSRRVALTEVGPDTEALREQDRGAVLFDLGIDALQVDCCIRVSDPKLAAELRAHVGRSLFEAGNPAMGLILVHSPDRVFITRVGRAEVYQAIPQPGDKAPEGPHTHVLPRLLAHRRTHAATEPIPRGLGLVRASLSAASALRRLRARASFRQHALWCLPASAVALWRHRARQAQAQCREGRQRGGRTGGNRDAG